MINMNIILTSSHISTSELSGKYSQWWLMRMCCYLFGKPKDTALLVGRSGLKHEKILISMANPHRRAVFWSMNISTDSARALSKSLTELADQLDLVKD